MTYRTAKGVVLLVVLSALPALIANRWHPELRAGPSAPLADHEVSMAIASAWVPDLLWVDVRGDEPFNRGHIPRAISLDSSLWEARLGRLLEIWHPGLKIVVYCDAAGCDLSKQIAARLRDEAGLPDVFFLRGGWEAWQQQQR